MTRTRGSDVRDLWDTISQNPALLIILALAALSWLGNLAGGAAKKAQQEAQRRAQAQRAQQRQSGPAAAPREVRVQQRPEPVASGAPTAEEIAAEIRRVMGFEPEPRRVEPVPRPVPVPVVVEDHERWAGERRKPAPAAKPHPTPRPTRARPTRPQRHGRSRIDLSDPAAAFVLMEVLGKPRALRGFDVGF